MNTHVGGVELLVWVGIICKDNFLDSNKWTLEVNAKILPKTLPDIKAIQNEYSTLESIFVESVLYESMRKTAKVL